MREQLPIDLKTDYDHRIMEHLTSGADFRKAEMILIYMHYGSEIRTDTIIESALSMGKRVFVPRVDGKEMDFYEIHGVEDCAAGYMGIPEPVQSAGKLVFPTEIKKDDILMVLPGLVFDEAGNRIGYGGGFYDRFLSVHPECNKIGVAYEFQCVDQIIPEENDIPVDGIVTEKRVITVKS